MINSYPTVYALGHKAIIDIFTGPVVVEEKIDGSQFSFGLVDGVLECRSKGKQLVLDAPEKMFTRAVASVRERLGLLNPGWIYRGEYLQTGKHNTLSYARVPAGHIIGFDIVTGPEIYLTPDEKRAEFARIGLECVPHLYSGIVDSMDMFNGFLQRESVLGGCKVEGVVVKNYSLFTVDKKVAMGKYVTEAFKEMHTSDWKDRNPESGDVVRKLIGEYRTEARWNKAVQHLRENGTLDGSPKDIGPLLREVSTDVYRECADEIKQKLFDWAWPKIQRGITTGLPEWWKQELAKSAFEDKE